MVNLNRYITFSIFIAFFLISCNGYVISEEAEIETGIWKVKEEIVLKAPISDIEKIYNVFIDIDINENFLTNNIWLFISTQSPSGNIQSDTLLFYIADDKGKWFGKKHGTTISNKFLYKQYIKFPEKGDYIFNIQHGMRENDLPKVDFVGINIELADETNGY